MGVHVHEKGLPPSMYATDTTTESIERAAHLSVMTKEEYDEQVAWERQRWYNIRFFLEIAIEEAIALHPGSYAFDILYHELEELRPPQCAKPTPARKKKQINGTLRVQVYERDMYRCVTCGTHLNLSLDHIVPESNGGPTTLENLQALCKSCNSRKGTRV